MRYWWVNQNQTFDQEFGGGYLWSPKRKQNGGINRFYENMRIVSPGDVILSFKSKRIAAAGIATSHCYECPKPAEFKDAGPNWSRIGWKVDVAYRALDRQIVPANHIQLLGPLLPKKYSPLQASGRGNQGVYLAEIPEALMLALADLVGPEVRVLMNAPNAMASPSAVLPDRAGENIAQWEKHLRETIEWDDALTESERTAVVLARKGQGRFKENVQKIETRCRITGVGRIEHLRASHIRPWRDCSTTTERLDGENGLLLTPSIDHLFDRGFISFENSGRLIVSPVADHNSLERMGVACSRPVKVGAFTEGQRQYLDYHRDLVLLSRAN